MSNLSNNIKHRWALIRLQPIRVFCLHHVSNDFDPDSMNEADWMQIDDFKNKVLDMQRNGVEFISLTEAYNKIINDKFRFRKYAVLTFDDGYFSLLEVLPWLNEQHIPATLFLNPAYLDGNHFRDRCTEKYLSDEILNHLHNQYPLVTIGSHGWDHKDAMNQPEVDFLNSVQRSVNYLQRLPNFIPYFAYTYGHRTLRSIILIKKLSLVPVVVDGGMNVNNKNFIDRELFI